jgi:hypothetical protein
MARYKPYDVNQVTVIPVSFPDQILPGSFEYALKEIVDEHIDLCPFEARYQNDETGCRTRQDKTSWSHTTAIRRSQG